MGAARRSADFYIGKVGIDGSNSTPADVNATLQASTASIGKLAANDGVDIGNVDVASMPLATTSFTVAEATNLGTTAVQLASNVCKAGVWITNTHASQFVVVGDSNVSHTNKRYIRLLQPGETEFFPGIGNSNALYVAGSAASTAFTYGGY